jgi:hypothetical protein
MLINPHHLATWQMNEGDGRVLYLLHGKTLRADDETSEHRPSACPADDLIAEYGALAEGFAVAIGIEMTGHDTSPYVQGWNAFPIHGLIVAQDEDRRWPLSGWWSWASDYWAVHESLKTISSTKC